MTALVQPLEEFRSDPLHGRLVSRLRDMIIAGELGEGEPISEKELCARFGVSRTPLREALKVLGSEGLVDLLPRRGAVVSEVRAADIVEKFSVIRMFEAYAVAWICDHGAEPLMAHLRSLHNQLIAAHESGKSGDYFEANECFHRALVEATGNRTLIDLHASLVSHLRRARFQGMNSQHMSHNFVDDHERVLAAILARRGAEAVREIEEHQRHVEADTLAMISKG